MSPRASEPSSTELARRRERMVERQLRRRGIEDERVMDAMGAVPRERFVPEAQRSRAYRDGALPIGEGQTVSQPWIVARMAELLELEGPERVLEVGTGSGYAAAVLARLCSHVVTIERHAGARPAGRREHWRELGIRNVEVRTGDGSAGVPDRAPFDAISVTAAATDGPPRALVDQLAPGAPLVCPIERGAGERLVRIRDGREETIAAGALRAAGGGRVLKREAPPAGWSCARQTGDARSPWSSPRRGVLALPKGHPDAGETLEQAATREVREEAGVVAEPVEQLGEIRYWYTLSGERVLKTVTFFLFDYRSGSVEDHDDEVESAVWMPLEEAAEALSYKGEREIAAKALARGRAVDCRAVFVLNFYSAVFTDQLKRGRKTATIRVGDKSKKYRKGEVVLVTVGFQHSPRERIFEAVIDGVEVKRVRDLSPRDIEHDNPEFRRLDETVHFLEQIYGRKVEEDDVVTVVRFSQISDRPPEIAQRMQPGPHQN